MRQSIRAAVTGGIIVAAAVAQATAAMASGQGYVVVNTNDDVAIQQVYVANAGETDAWRPANMSYAIAPGTESRFTLPGANCFYDIKVRFSDGATQTFSNVDVCRGMRLIAT